MSQSKQNWIGNYTITRSRNENYALYNLETFVKSNAVISNCLEGLNPGLKLLFGAWNFDNKDCKNLTIFLEVENKYSEIFNNEKRKMAKKK